MKQYLYLFIILLLAIVLRFWQLGSNPPALTWDEAAWGYNAYALGSTARDEFGRKLPFNYLESFGDFKPPVYAYLTILPVKIFGLNALAVRFPSAFFGVLAVLLTYFLVKELFYNSQFTVCYALFASFLLAISPWHIMLSRAAFEANAASFFVIAGMTFFLIGLRRTGFWFLSVTGFALSFYTFNTARIVTPVLILVLMLGYYKQIWFKKSTFLLSVVLGLILLLPLIPFLLTPQASLRYKEVNIFSDPALIQKANQAMANDSWVWWSRVIHNRRWIYAQAFLQHYFDNLNPSFLFIKGDGNPKFSTRDVGELYLWELPFLIIGGFYLLKTRPKNWWLIFVWLLVSIIPAAVARETPHALRIENGLPTWQILVAVGLVFLWQRRVKISVFVFLVMILNFVYFQHGYWRHYVEEFSGEWQYGYQPAIEFIASMQKQYDQIWFTDKLGRPYIYFLFYLKYDPQKFAQESTVERETFGFVKVRSFDHYYFFTERKEIKPEGKALVVDDFKLQPQGVEIKQVFYLLNGKPLLVAYEI